MRDVEFSEWYEKAFFAHGERPLGVKTWRDYKVWRRDNPLDALIYDAILYLKCFKDPLVGESGIESYDHRLRTLHRFRLCNKIFEIAHALQGINLRDAGTCDMPDRMMERGGIDYIAMIRHWDFRASRWRRFRRSRRRRPLLNVV